MRRDDGEGEEGEGDNPAEGAQPEDRRREARRLGRAGVEQQREERQQQHEPERREDEAEQLLVVAAQPQALQRRQPECGPAGPSRELMVSSGTIVRAYRIFVLVDAGDEWVQDLPDADDGICFRKPGLDETRASAEELRQAHRATSEV